MLNKKLIILFSILLTLFLFSSTFYYGSCALTEDNQIEYKLKLARISVEEAFKNIYSAEKDLININGLIIQLNNASTSLANGINAYNSGDHETAINNANLAILIAKEVISNLEIQKEKDIGSLQTTFLSTISLTILFSFLFILSLFLVWKLIRRYYEKSLYRTKPEVNEQ